MGLREWNKRSRLREKKGFSESGCKATSNGTYVPKVNLKIIVKHLEKKSAKGVSAGFMVVAE
jgi:hypothetical protein